jgi:hypothetical protein
MNSANPMPNNRAEILPKFESDLLTREQAAAYLGLSGNEPIEPQLAALTGSVRRK